MLCKAPMPIHSVSEFPALSTLKARRTAARCNRVSVSMMRPAADQLAILTTHFAEVAKLPMGKPDNRAALKSLALASVMVIDSMSSEMTAR